MSDTAIEDEPALTLLEALEGARPIKRRVEVEGWPRPVWVWKLEFVQLLELSSTKLWKEGDRGKAEFGIELLALCLGDENAPGAFRSANGRSWLRRQGEAIGLLIPVAIEFNELNKSPSADNPKPTEQEPS